MYLLSPKRWLDNRLGPSRLGLSEGDSRRPKGRFRLKQLTDICLAPTVIVSVVAHQPSPQSSPLLRVPPFIKGQDLGGGLFHENPSASRHKPYRLRSVVGAKQIGKGLADKIQTITGNTSLFLGHLTCWPIVSC